MKLQIIFLLLLLIALIVVVILHFTSPNQVISYEKQTVPSTLVLVQVLSRHGVRSMEEGHMYPKDPHYNYSYFPSHHGNLNNKGKLASYNLGKELRERYDEFLGDEYYNGLIKSFTSDYDRTQMTLQCVQAGLFSKLRGPIPNMNWRPITYEVFEFKDDRYIALFKYCPTMPRPIDPPEDEKTRKLFEFLTEKSGFTVNSLYDMVFISDIFMIQLHYDLKLPEWSKTVYPEPMSSLQNKAWSIYADRNLRLGGGMIKLITDQILLKIKQPSEAYNRKLILYSGHDYSLLFFLKTLKIWDGIAADFSAYITFELHRFNGIYVVKIFYQNRRDNEIKQLKLPFCKEDLCPLDAFIANTKWLYEPQPECPKF